MSYECISDTIIYLYTSELSSSSFSGLSELESLNVESCGLRTLSLPHLGRLRELRLGGNPLACDCRSAWLWDLANRKHVDVDGAVCATPFARRNDRINHIRGDTEHYLQRLQENAHSQETQLMFST